MATGRLVTIYGATGVQGGTVIKSMLDNKAKAFVLRAVSRNPDSDEAMRIAALGVEVVKGDGMVKHEMVRAFKSSWAVFINTRDPNSETLREPAELTETDIGRIIVDAAFEAGVQHFIYSGLVSATLLTHGNVPSSSFDEKHTIGEYAKSKGFKSVVIVSAGWYFENHLDPWFAQHLGGFPTTPDEDGYLTLRMPRMRGNDEIPFIAMEADYGDLVHAVLLEPESYNGQLIQAISQLGKPEKLVSTFQKRAYSFPDEDAAQLMKLYCVVAGRKARCIILEDWKSLQTYDDPNISALKTMFGFCQYTGGQYFGVPYDVEVARRLKAKASLARGLLAEEHPPLTIEGFWRKQFS